MKFGFNYDGIWTFSTGQSGGGYHVGQWFEPDKKRWRVTCETDAGAYRERFGDWQSTHSLLCRLEDLIQAGKLTEAHLVELLPDMAEEFAGNELFGRFA